MIIVNRPGTIPLSLFVIFKTEKTNKKESQGLFLGNPRLSGKLSRRRK